MRFIIDRDVFTLLYTVSAPVIQFVFCNTFFPFLISDKDLYHNIMFNTNNYCLYYHITTCEVQIFVNVFVMFVNCGIFVSTKLILFDIYLSARQVSIKRRV